MIDDDYTIEIYSNLKKREVVYNILFKRYDLDIELMAITQLLSLHNSEELDLGFIPVDDNVLIQLLLLRNNRGVYQKLDDFLLSELLNPLVEEDDIFYGDAA